MDSKDVTSAIIDQIEKAKARKKREALEKKVESFIANEVASSLGDAIVSDKKKGTVTTILNKICTPPNITALAAVASAVLAKTALAKVVASNKEIRYVLGSILDAVVPKVRVEEEEEETEEKEEEETDRQKRKSTSY